jgi:hypothetical protein
VLSEGPEGISFLKEIARLRTGNSLSGKFSLRIKNLFMNIIETVQKNLGFMTLKKIDPNTQEITGQEVDMGNSALAQAGIPSILLGIYNSLEQNPDLNILDTNEGKKLERIFGKDAEIVVKKITGYAKIQDEHSSQELEHIASESMRVVKERIGEGANESSIRNFIGRNKPDTLLYLPPSLDLGTILQNNNLDDRTGKMEGPISSLTHRLEKLFNTSNSN